MYLSRFVVDLLGFQEGGRNQGQHLTFKIFPLGNLKACTITCFIAYLTPIRGSERRAHMCVQILIVRVRERAVGPTTTVTTPPPFPEPKAGIAGSLIPPREDHRSGVPSWSWWPGPDSTPPRFTLRISLSLRLALSINTRLCPVNE